MSEIISIIIPAYNAEKYLERTLNSVTNQTYRDLEIIVVDDGSTDNTFIIAKDFAKIDKRVIALQKQNEGVTKARDFGISYSTGKYIGFVDADDTIEPEMYQTLYDNIVKYNADISHCGHKIIYDNGSVEYFKDSKIIKEQGHNQGIIDIISGELIGPSLCTKLYNKELFIDLEYDKSLRINEDYVINLLAFSNSNNSIFVDECFYNYYQNQGSGSSNLDKEYFYRDMIKAAELTKEKFADDKGICFVAQRRWFRILSTMYRNQGKMGNVSFDYKSFFKEIRTKIKLEKDRLKRNRLLSKNEKFVLFMILHFPKLLILLFKYR